MITYYCVQVITLCINGTVQSKVSIFQILVVFVLVWSNGYLASIQHVSSISCPHLMFQRIANYKSFTRFHINRDGNLEVFTLAVDKVPREWMLDPDWDMEQKQPQQLSHREIP
ncbi:uncharacterized protein LOC108450608 isoform X1 [Gossypium arboreum]|uniref:uncharacterized protein LOC108450608 isoform X1 n=1 Tax=Gossypium arboreum TaxID=29729 RepID=UPI0022F19EF7|nr:uncharacterized protein LOC108450608 isoform X1 [Gossypium arboreum]